MTLNELHHILSYHDAVSFHADEFGLVVFVFVGFGPHFLVVWKGLITELGVLGP